MHKYRQFHFWHRTIGVFSALIVIILVVSGVMLNHTEDFKLDETYLTSPMLLKFYDIGAKSEPHGFLTDGIWVTQVGEHIYFDKTEVVESVESLSGVVRHNGMIVIGYDGQLLLMTDEGEVIERLGGGEGVPAGMRRLGIADEFLIIRGAHGDYQVNLDELQWHEEDELHAEWAERQTLPADLKKELLLIYQGTGLNLERVVLDFHSGRILGDWGIYLLDVMGLLMLILALSGVWMWWKVRNR